MLVALCQNPSFWENWNLRYIFINCHLFVWYHTNNGILQNAHYSGLCNICRVPAIWLTLWSWWSCNQHPFAYITRNPYRHGLLYNKMGYLLLYGMVWMHRWQSYSYTIPQQKAIRLSTRRVLIYTVNCNMLGLNAKSHCRHVSQLGKM